MKQPNFFTYVVSSGSIASGGGSTQVTITFASDSDFHLRGIRATGNTSVTVMMSLVSGEQFSSSALTTALLGNASNQGIQFFDSVIIPRQTQMKFTFTNNDSSAHTEEIQLWGIKQ
jgi:hypothetical protein